MTPNLGRPAPLRRSRRASTRLWAVSGLVLIVLATVFYLGFRDRADGGGPTRAVGAGSVEFDPAKAGAELETLQRQFTAAVEQKRDLRPVIDGARRFVERYPKLVEARTFRAQTLMMAGRIEEAYEQLVRSLALDRKQPEVALLAGTVALQLDRVVDAQHHYSQAVGLDPSQGRYRVHLATAYLKRQEYDRARHTLLEALRIDSSLYAAHAVLADIYARQNKLGPALDQIKRAIDLLPAGDLKRRVVYARQRAALLRRDNQPDEALAVLIELGKSDSQLLRDPTMSQDLASCWAMLGQPGKAAWHYEQILGFDQSNDRAAARAAHWRLVANDRAAARRNLDQLRRINPRHPDIPRLDAQLRDIAENEQASHNTPEPP